MARSSFSRLGIINVALGRAGYAEVEALEDTSKAFRQASRFYDARVDGLLGMFPWNFATRKLRMTQTVLPEAHPTGKIYRYDLPSDGVYLWDVYPYRGFSREFNDSWDGIQYPYVIFPVVSLGELTLDPTVGEFLDGAFYSNYESMYCLYTHNSPVRPQDFTVQFRDTLMLQIEDDLRVGRQKDAETLSVLGGQNKAAREALLVPASYENRKNMPKVPRSETLRRMDKWV